MSDELEKLELYEKGATIQETAKIEWKALQRFFAAGKVNFVTGDLDLVETALQFSRDNSEQVESCMQEGNIAPVADGQARRWHEEDIVLWTAAVKPWVLVQEVN